jgi:hypothetical protein
LKGAWISFRQRAGSMSVKARLALDVVGFSPWRNQFLTLP